MATENTSSGLNLQHTSLLDQKKIVGVCPTHTTGCEGGFQCEEESIDPWMVSPTLDEEGRRVINSSIE